jgi:hypothetical protein
MSNTAHARVLEDKYPLESGLPRRFDEDDVLASCLSFEPKSKANNFSYGAYEFVSLDPSDPLTIGCLHRAPKPQARMIVGPFNIGHYANYFYVASENKLDIDPYSYLKVPTYPLVSSANVISPSGCYSATDALNEMLTALVATTAELLAKSFVKPANLLPAFEQLERYSNLERDWDGEGAAEIPAMTITRARWVLEVVANEASYELPSVGPMPDGRISLTWETGQKELWVYVDVQSFTSHKWNTPGEFKAVVRTWQNAAEIAEDLEWLTK